jgi:dienelactone hydrolase
MTAPTSTLSGWERVSFSAAGMTHDIFGKAPSGGGPGVVVIPEIPGLSPEVLAFADHLVAAGFSVVVPSLFGTPGKPVTAGYAMTTFARACVSKEMKAFAVNSERPISQFLRALCADLNARTPGPGVGVVAMCFTGGFALATAVDEAVLAAVMSQPSVPVPIGRARRVDIGLSPSETGEVVRRTQDGLCLMGLRFSGDRAATADRFAAYAATFGDAIELIVLDSSKGNPDGYKSTAHSVLTAEVRDSPVNSAYDARERVVTFLRNAVKP